MNYSTQWILDLKDRTAQKLGQTKRNFQQTTQSVIKLRQEQDKLPRSIEALTTKLRSLEIARKKTLSVSEIRRFNEEIRRTQHEVRKLQNLSGRATIGQRLRGAGASVMGALGPAASMMMPGLGVAGGAYMVGRGVMSVLTDMKELEKAMSNVRAITGATGEDFIRLKKAAIDMGRETKFTSIEAADAMTYLGMAGFKTDKIISSLPHVLNLAAAGNLDLGRSADIVSNIMGQFNITAVNTDRVVNVLAATATSSNTNIEQLSQALKYLGPTMNALKVPIEDTAALVGILGDSGVQGTLAGRALGTALVNLTNPTTKVEKAMKDMNLRLFDAKGNFVGMPEMIAQIERGTARMTQEQRAANLSMLLGNEAFQEINILLERGSEKYKEYASSITGTNKAMEMAQVQMDNWAGDIDRAKGMWDTFIQGLNGSEGTITNHFRKITQNATLFLNVLNAINKGYKNVAHEELLSGNIGVAEASSVRKANLKSVQNEVAKAIQEEIKKGKSEREAAEAIMNKEDSEVKEIQKELSDMIAGNTSNKKWVMINGKMTNINASSREDIIGHTDELSMAMARRRVAADVFEKSTSNGNKVDSVVNGKDPSAGIGKVRGEGVKNLVMNVEIKQNFQANGTKDRKMLKELGEGVADVLIDAGRDALVILGD